MTRLAILLTAFLLLPGVSLAQGRPAALRAAVAPYGQRVGVGSATWILGQDAAVAFLLPSWNRLAAGVELSLTRFDPDEATVRARLGLPSTEPIRIDGGARWAPAVAIRGEYSILVDPGECNWWLGGLVRPYLALAAGYSRVETRSSTVAASSVTFHTGTSRVDAVAFTFAFGSDWVRWRGWALFAETRYTGYWDISRPLGIREHWANLRVGVARQF